MALKYNTTADIKVSKRIVDQIIGQEEAINLVKKASKQRRNLLLIGEPGTGKSMIGQAMAELLPNEKLVDVLSFPNPADDNVPLVRTMPKGQGRDFTTKAKIQAMGSFKNQNIILFIFVLIASFLPYYFYSRKIFPFDNPIIYAASMITSIVVIIGFMLFLNLNKRMGAQSPMQAVPKLVIDNADTKKAPFIDATGAHAGALLGDVLHDPLQCHSSVVNLSVLKRATNNLLQIEEENISEKVDLMLNKNKDIIQQEDYLATYLNKGDLEVVGEKDGVPDAVEVMSVNKHLNKHKNLIKLITETGKELIVTPEHKVAIRSFFNNIKYIRADCLKPWHKLVTLE